VDKGHQAVTKAVDDLFNDGGVDDHGDPPPSAPEGAPQ
jgi:hypothetical protein